MRRYSVLGAIALLAGGAPAVKAAQVELTLEQRCQQADAVIIGEVTSGEVAWTATGSIETRRWIATQRVIRGKVPSTVEVTLPGGRMQDLGLVVEDTPVLEEDRRYVLFLEADAAGKGFHVFGGEAGAWLVQAPNGGPGVSHLEALRLLAVCHE